MIDPIFRLDNQTAVVTGACGKLGPVWVEALLDGKPASARLRYTRLWSRGDGTWRVVAATLAPVV